ncbi:hypothetical protein FQN54_000510 [Arachnomyces sp. PD_36]|nr:hypothetical protein FQN54_000510 [Arachnomyces sp. PD_36]
MEDQIGNFFVGFRRPDPTAALYKVEVNTPQYTFVANAAAIAIKVLQTQKSKNALVRLALAISSHTPTRAPIQNVTQASHVVDLFISKISQKFPGIIVDATIADVRMLGYHVGVAWQGSLDQFNTRSQVVHVNAARLQDLISAANTTPASNHGRTQFRIFMFQLANTLVHEVGGHLFMTFISQNMLSPTGQLQRPFTPESVTYSDYGSQGVGESGRLLESAIFGGSMEYFRDNTAGDRQAGVPYILNETNNSVRRISQTTIDNFVINQDFVFPYPLQGPAHPWNTMPSLANVQGPVELPDPSLRPQIPLELVPHLAGSRVRFSQLRLALSNPSILAVPA